MAFITRARVVVFTTVALFRTRDTVAVETRARRATCSRLIFYDTCQYTLYRLSKTLLIGASVTSFACPAVRNSSGLPDGFFHADGSFPVATNAGMSICPACRIRGAFGPTI